MSSKFKNQNQKPPKQNPKPLQKSETNLFDSPHQPLPHFSPFPPAPPIYLSKHLHPSNPPIRLFRPPARRLLKEYFHQIAQVIPDLNNQQIEEIQYLARKSGRAQMLMNGLMNANFQIGVGIGSFKEQQRIRKKAAGQEEKGKIYSQEEKF